MHLSFKPRLEAPFFTGLHRQLVVSVELLFKIKPAEALLIVLMELSALLVVNMWVYFIKMQPINCSDVGGQQSCGSWKTLGFWIRKGP